jgi:small conductance mechanosensitive channel
MKDNKPLPKDGIKETAKLDQVKKVKVPLTKEQINARQALINKIAKISFQSLVVVSALFLAIFSNLLFGDSEFGDIINRTLGKFFDIGSLISNNYLRILETLTILLFIWILNRIYDAVVAIFVPKKAQTGTTMLLLKSLIRNLLAFLGILFILTAWGVDSVTLLASVGLIGLVISFGAQSIVEDIISGLFLIIEKQFSVGDIIIIDDFRGKVMEIGLRTTKFLDLGNSDLKIVNNSQVKNVINASINLSTAVTEVGIAYEVDLEKLEDLIAKDFIPEFKKKYVAILEGDVTYLGVSALADSSVNLKFAAKVKESDRPKTIRFLNREFKIFCDRHGIDIPFPQVTVNYKVPPKK